MKNDILKIGLDPLIHFECIARCRSLKRAADELCLSQSAITQSLSKLENNLGVKLCVRSRSEFGLTKAGEQLYQVSKEIKRNLKSYESFLSDENEFNGLFSIGVIDNFQNKAFEKAFSKTIHHFPKMKLSIQFHAATEIQSLVATGEIDVGLGIFNRKLEQLTYRVIGEERIGHYISESHSLWSRRELTTTDLKNRKTTWVDIIHRDRTALDEIFAETKKQRTQVNAYTNDLNAAVIILRSGTSIVPLPLDYLGSRNLDFKYRSLNSALPPYSVKQEVATRREFVNASPAACFFLNQLPRFVGKQV